jgi:retinol dehydrogenase 12
MSAQINVEARNKVAVITGASAGIGAAAAKALAARGWRVIALGRTQSRLDASLATIRSATPNAQVHGLIADFESMADVERVARDIAALTDRIDVLVNNAGGICKARTETADGFEALFAANHLGPFLLTQRLLPQLRAASSARVINVSSVAHKFVKDMVWDDLQLKQNFSVTTAYGQSKLANILFTRELARRLAVDGITVNAMHPGMVGSNFPTHGDRMTAMMYVLAKPFTLSSEQGADTIVWLATAPEVAGKSGGYYIKRREARTTPAAQSDASARKLWDVSEQLLAGARLK